MRRMIPRQAIWKWVAIAFMLSGGACTPAAPGPTPTALPPTFTFTPVPTPTSTPVPTATPLGCLSEPGRVESGVVETTKPPQMFLIYLPRCYDEMTGQRYPVLYLLHGQTYTDDQWVRLGAPQVADRLIRSGEAAPFIIVFPDDRYWNLEAGPGFGERVIDGLIPYVDANYRTLPDRAHRALGGLSRGGGWTVRLGLTHPELFGMMGLHSPAVFSEDASEVASWIGRIPAQSFPRLWLDIGDQDKELGYARQFEALLALYEVPHEFHLFSGDHSEVYWGAHVEEYLSWYVEGW